MKNVTDCKEKYLYPVLDWLAFTLPSGEVMAESLNLIRALLGNLTPTDRGLKGYKQVYTLDKSGGFVGMDNDRPEMGIHCVLPSGALGYYNEDVDPYTIIDTIYAAKGWVTRFDIAFDDYNKHILLEDVERKVWNGEVISRLRSVTRVVSGSVKLINESDIDNSIDISRMSAGKRGAILGNTLYLGNRKKSNLFIRIYDKRVESGCFEHDHWVRIELCVKGPRARSMAPQLKNHTLQELLNGHLSFRDPVEGFKKTDWPTTGWWSKFLATTKRDKIDMPRQKRSIETIRSHIFTQAIKNLAALNEVFGEDIVDEAITEGRKKLADDPRTRGIVERAKRDILKGDNFEELA